MSVKQRHVRNILLMTFAIQFSVFIAIAPDLSFLGYLSVLIMLFVVGEELFWLLEFDKIVR